MTLVFLSAATVAKFQENLGIKYMWNGKILRFTARIAIYVGNCTRSAYVTTDH